MAIAAGLASGIDELGARIGQRLELEARRRDVAEQSRTRRHRRRALLDKLKPYLVG
ncbi:hypothetical protein [Nocardioides psychrotolerans]|jgi:hypothetical protein|uniref:hypothetical protein n=1 Tax=Nocardioides psychrotolerans TaxID=1005945 RepID=UPI003138114D